MTNPRGWNLRKGQPDGDKGRQVGASLGWKALVAKKGIEKAASYLINYRLDNPSGPEQIAISALEHLGLKYKREHVVSYHPLVIVDFLIGDVALEIDGGVHHHGIESKSKNGEWQKERERLILSRGLRLLRVRGKDLER